MSLSADNVVQENTGYGSPATLGSGTTAGNTVVVFVNDTGIPSITGFTQVKSNGTHYVLVKSEVPAGESSWTFATGLGAWYVVELSNIDAVDPLDASATGSGSVGNGGTLSTGTTGLNAGLSTVEFAMFGGGHGATTSWAGYTNGFVEVADVSATATPTYGLAVARKFTEGTTGTFESTATLTTSGSAQLTYATMVVFRAADSPIVAPLAHHVGFDQGTHGGGATTGSASIFGGLSAPTGTWGTSYLIQASSARNSAYGLRTVQSGAAGSVRVGSLGGITSGCAGFNVRVVSATGTVEVASLLNNTGLTPYAQVLYDSSATKFGVRVLTTGTTSWATTTTALNTWVWIDLRLKTTTSTWHAEWRLETGAGTYTDQPAADTGGQSPGLPFWQLELGRNAAQTMTADFDDVILSKYYVAYPLGPHEVRLLTVDPAGTPTISGTTTNFSTFASNGTLTAWNATTARNAVDEVPVTISAAADGVTQTAAAASDYMEFPMQPYTLGATEFVDGVRMMAAIGSGTGAGAGDIAIRGWDGTTETALATVSQLTPGSPTAITSTVPLWRCAMWQSTNGWTQAELDAAALRAGFSADATPDMWVHVLYLEVAIGKTKTVPVIGEPGSSETTVEYDPTRAAMVSATLDTPADQGATMRWTDTGGSGSQAVGAASSYTKQFNAADSGEVSMVEVESDPEFTERE